MFSFFKLKVISITCFNVSLLFSQFQENHIKLQEQLTFYDFIRTKYHDKSNYIYFRFTFVFCQLLYNCYTVYYYYYKVDKGEKVK